MTRKNNAVWAARVQVYVDNFTVAVSKIVLSALSDTLEVTINALRYKLDASYIAEAAAVTIRQEFPKVYFVVYSVLSKEYGKDYVRTFAPRFKADEFDEWDPYEDEAMRNWINTTTATKISKIAAATQASIRALIDEAVRTGDGIDNISRNLQQLYGFSSSRATKIARTEVLSAVNATSHFVMGKFIGGSNMRKSWLATNDKRTRHTHLAANGQGQEYDTPFEVGGSKLMFPGDTSLGAAGKEVIACRCTVLYYAK
jgi:hypothetical protein